MTSFVGTANYIAPEILRNGFWEHSQMAYELSVDMWSLGCILYRRVAYLLTRESLL
jgi:serine/threonine protein kinase